MYVVLDQYSSWCCYCSIYNTAGWVISKCQWLEQWLHCSSKIYVPEYPFLSYFPFFAVTGVNKVVTYTIWNTTLNKVFMHKDVIVSSLHRSLPLFADTRADNISFKGGRFTLSVFAAVCWFVVRDWHHASHRYIRARPEDGVHRQLVSWHFVCVCVCVCNIVHEIKTV